jgi:hypothetical protein
MQVINEIVQKDNKNKKRKLTTRELMDAMV